jgi:hypothetical protein
MKIVIKSVLLMIVGLIVAFNLFAQKPADLVGTWIGPATLETEGDPNELTLVLKLEEGKLNGHLSGQYGTLNEAALMDIELSEGVFKFAVNAIGPNSGELRVVFEMKVEGDSMKGRLEIPDMGVSGTWEAEKQ